MEDMQMNNFLQLLYEMSSGDTGADVSMYAIGEHLGLDRVQAGSIAEDLIIDGFAELKTLAGGVAITAKGLEALGRREEGGAGNSMPERHRLGSNPVLDDDDRQAVDSLLDELKQAIFSSSQGYEKVEELIIDIKTIEVQLLSPRPKTSVIKEVLGSIAGQLQDCGDGLLGSKIACIAGIE
ncbi:MAG: hypothetical protein LJE64_01985 [Desulfofustis sp.]|nr:hypothetical protein [Desulfofustis sp.]